MSDLRMIPIASSITGPDTILVVQKHRPKSIRTKAGTHEQEQVEGPTRTSITLFRKVEGFYLSLEDDDIERIVDALQEGWIKP